MVYRDPHCTPGISRPIATRSSGSGSEQRVAVTPVIPEPQNPSSTTSPGPNPNGRPGRSQSRSGKVGRAPGDCGGGCKRALGRTFFSRAVCGPGRGPAAVFRAGGAPRGGVPTRPTRPRGSTTAGRDPESGDRSRLLDRLRQQSRLSWITFIDRHGKPGRPDGARSRWRVSPTSELGPWRPCESVPGVLPAPPRASRPTPSPRRPGCQEAAGAPPRAPERPPLPGPRARREGDSCYDAQRSLASTRKDQRAGGCKASVGTVGVGKGVVAPIF